MKLRTKRGVLNSYIVSSIPALSRADCNSLSDLTGLSVPAANADTGNIVISMQSTVISDNILFLIF